MVLRASAMEKGGSLSCRWRRSLGELRPDQVGAGGEELAELDVAGAEAGDGAGDPARLGLPDAERPGENADRQRRGAGQVERERHLGARRHEAHAMLRQHDAGARKAEDVADGCGHERREMLRGIQIVAVICGESR